MSFYKFPHPWVCILKYIHLVLWCKGISHDQSLLWSIWTHVFALVQSYTRRAFTQMAFRALIPLETQTSMSSSSSYPPDKQNVLFCPFCILRSYPIIPDYDPPIPSFFLFFILLNLPKLLKENIGVRLFVCLYVFFQKTPEIQRTW